MGSCVADPKFKVSSVVDWHVKLTTVISPGKNTL